MVSYLDFESSFYANNNNVSGTGAINFTNSGVNFTWTTTNGDGTNGAFVQAYSSTFGTATNYLVGYIGNNGGSPSTTQEVFTLAPTGGQYFSGTSLSAITLKANFDWNNVKVTFVGANGYSDVVLGPQTGLNTFTGIIGQYSAIKFTTTSVYHPQYYINIKELSAKGVFCFMPETMIETPDGPRAVETLQPGDLVLTKDGRTTPVRWLAEQKINTAVAHPAKINPIRINAGALGNGLPRRDLFVSPDHGIEIDGYLVNAAAMVNGTTITQVKTMPREFTYYHVETDAHELIIAEGVAAETFVDYEAVEGFDNGELRETPTVQEMPLPRISSARMLPTTVRLRLSADNQIAA